MPTGKELFNMAKILNFYSDAGHGWLAVRRADIPPELFPEITAYSYEDSSNLVYLEEDCDASKFLESSACAGQVVTFNEIYLGVHAFIRDLPRFRDRGQLEYEPIQGERKPTAI